MKKKKKESDVAFIGKIFSDINETLKKGKKEMPKLKNLGTSTKKKK